MDLILLYSSLYKPLQWIVNEYIHLDIEDETDNKCEFGRNFMYKAFCLNCSISDKLFEKYTDSIFIKACEERSLAVVSKLINNSHVINMVKFYRNKWGRDYIIDKHLEVAGGNFDLIKMLLSCEDYVKVSRFATVNLVRTAINNGDLQMYSWLAEHFQCSKADCRSYFLDALQHGKLDIAKSIHNKYKFTKRDILVCNDGSNFVDICRSNCVDTIKWVYEEFKLSKMDCSRYGRIWIYYEIYEKCSVEVIKWIHLTLKPERCEILDSDNSLYLYTCTANNWEVAEYLRKELNITREERQKYIRKLSNDDGVNKEALSNELSAP